MNISKQHLLKAGIGLGLLQIIAMPVGAQSLPTETVPMIVTPHNQTIDYRERTLCFSIPANVDYTLQVGDADWITARKGADGSIYIHAQQNYNNSTRTGTVTLTNADKKLTKTVSITQGPDASINLLKDNSYVKPSSATANTEQGGAESISASYDRNMSTLYHSAYSYKVSETTPAVLTYKFTDVDYIDRIIYNPRSGNVNGNFGKVTVSYQLKGQSGFTKLGDYDLKESSNPHQFNIPEGLKNPVAIQFEVKSGANGFASCAEMEFYDSKESMEPEFSKYFADSLYSQLKPGITAESIDTIPNLFIRSLAYKMLSGQYGTDYRVASYPCHLSPATQSEQWAAPGKYYDQISGVTGIHVPARSKQALVVRGIPDDMLVQLKIVAWYTGKVGQNFDGGDPNTMTFTLRNGVNIIDYNYGYDGLAYVCYYSTDDPHSHPDVSVHFMNSIVNGYLSPDKTNEEMDELCKNAPNAHMDLLGDKVHAIWTSKGLAQYCKASDNKSLGYIQYMNILDSLVGWEHRLLGLEKYNRVPDNRTMAYVNYTYYMFQGSFGVSFHQNQESRVLNCNRIMYNDFDAIWGLSHEWGHQHQMTPYFCWASQSECTNNMNSCYNTIHMGYKGNQISRITSMWTQSYNAFMNDGAYGATDTLSSARLEAYNRISDFSWCPEFVDSINAQHKRFVRIFAQNITNNKGEVIHKAGDPYWYVPNQKDDFEHSGSIYESGVEVQLAAFYMLCNYFGEPENEGYTKDFQQDIYESLRQNDYENGSSIEPDYENGQKKAKTTRDKYEILAAAQNGNKGGAYEKFRAQYPNSVWTTHNYITSSSSYTQNSTPFILNYIRKASKMCGYNLFNYFDRFGFLRTTFYAGNDYGWKFVAMTDLMKEEFKKDMEALGLPDIPEDMIVKIAHANIKTFPTPNFPNTPTPRQ